jgi:hypothetical protein
LARWFSLSLSLSPSLALLCSSTSHPGPVLHSCRHRPLEFCRLARVLFARRSSTSSCSLCRHSAALSDWSLLAVGVCVLVRYGRVLVRAGWLLFCSTVRVFAFRVSRSAFRVLRFAFRVSRSALRSAGVRCCLGSLFVVGLPVLVLL